jgi:hypothetical protein
VQGQPLAIERLERRTESLPPPLLYDLTQLQRDMNLRHGMSAQRTLEVAQELYEKKLLTYPRTDSRHLSLDMVDPVRTTLAQLRAWDQDKLAVLAKWIAGAPDGERGPKAKKKRVFDDGKVSDHHAIVPTGKVEALAGEAQLVFDAVATRFVQVFLGDRVQDVTTAHAVSNGVPFRARGVVVTDPGWSALEPEALAEEEARQGQGCRRRGRPTTATATTRRRSCPTLRRRRVRARTNPSCTKARPSRRGRSPRTRCWRRWRPRAARSTTSSCAKRCAARARHTGDARVDPRDVDRAPLRAAATRRRCASPTSVATWWRSSPTRC